METKVDAIVASALAKYQPEADQGQEPHNQGWLVARWCPEQCRVLFGCRWCEDFVEQGQILMPHIYRDKEKCHSFAYGNVATDLKRAIASHNGMQIHEKAVGLRTGGAMVAIGASPRVVDAEWKHAAYLCLKSIARLKPDDHFLDACKDAIYVGGFSVNDGGPWMIFPISETFV